MLRGKGSSILLLVAVFAVNWIETQAEAHITARFFANSDLGLRCAAPFRWLEGSTTADFANSTNIVAAYGYSIAYFLIFPLLAIGMAVALAKRPDPLYIRFFARAVAWNYILALPFYLFYPIPERWVFPESGATLLSDRVSSKLIEAFRPLSGLDNSFPSAHVSITVTIVAMAFIFRIPLKHCVLALGTTILLSTYVLGIHWLADILAGLASGILSTLIAVAMETKRSKVGIPSRTILADKTNRRLDILVSR